MSMERLLVDLRHSARALARRPGYTLLTVLTLGIGIGANAAVFSLANWLLLRPIAGVRAPDRLVTIRAGTPEGATFLVSEPERRDLEAGIPGLERLAGFQGVSLHVATPGSDEPRRLDAEVVSGNFFDVLGAGVILRGRGFLADEGTDPGKAGVAVVSHRLWRRDYDSDSAAVGKSILVNGHHLTIIGIAVPGFAGSTRSADADLWVPVAAHARVMPQYPPNLLSNRRSTVYLGLIGRLRNGASAAGVAGEAEVVRTRLAASDPANRRLRIYRMMIDPGLAATRWERQHLARVFGMLLGTVGLLLLLTCANVSNLMLSRATARQPEFATRQALGASRRRIVAQCMVESLLAAAGGGALALLAAAWITSMMRGTIVMPSIPELGDIALDMRVFAFAILVSSLAAVAAGTVPALTASRFDIITVLKTSGRSLARGRRRIRQGLTVLQVALSLSFLVGAALLARSMHERRAINPGFDPARILTFSVEPGLQGMDDAQRRAFYQSLTATVRDLPGVRGASLSWLRPFGLAIGEASMRPADTPGAAVVEGEHNMVGSRYFATMGIEVLAGRDFNEADLFHEDTEGSAGIAILSESLARQLFGTIDVVGRRIDMDYPKGRRREIVGVVRDARLRRLVDPPPGYFYEPYGQTFSPNWSSVVVALEAPARDVIPRLRQAVRSLDASLPLYDVLTLSDAIERHLAEHVLVSRVTITFAVLATLLAAIGLYGVLSQSVAERRPELGIRAALGAAPGQVVGMIVSDAMRLALTGAAVGALAAFWLVRFIEGRLFGVRTTDPLSYAVAVAGVLLVALLSALLPARRAAAVDPVVALRE
jgi:predicted permease